jgi:hypothetical protein
MGGSANCMPAGRVHDQGDVVTGDVALDSEQIIRRTYKNAEDKDIEGVDSLGETRAQLAEWGWTTEGSLGAGNSLHARDQDGMLAEFVETSGGMA